MLKLSPASTDLFWLDLLPGARVQFRPVTVASLLIARAALGKVYGGEDQTDVGVRAGIALVRELAQRGIVAWEGIGDAEGKPLHVTPDAIDALLDHWPAYDAIDTQYVSPALRWDEEKNASSISPAGTSAAALNTATPAT